VGGYFGGLLARAGAPVIMIGRPAFVEAVNKNGLFLDTLQFQENVRVQASTELSAAAGAEIILFCVKTTDDDATARPLAPLLAPGALVVSLQNGVDNVKQIRAAAISKSCLQLYTSRLLYRSPEKSSMWVAEIWRLARKLKKLSILLRFLRAQASLAESPTVSWANYGPSYFGIAP
jgi:ketopantoate reductase